MDAQDNTQLQSTGSAQESRSLRPRAQAILAATARLIGERGVAETTVSEVGRAMNMRKSVVHYYFANKQALVSAVQELAEQQLLTRIRAALQPADAHRPRDFRSFLRPLFGAAQADGAFALRLQFWAESRRDTPIAERVSETRTKVRAAVEQAITESQALEGAHGIDRDLLTTLIISASEGLALAELLEGDRARAGEAYDLLLKLVEGAVSEARIEAEKPASSLRAAAQA